MPPWRLAERTPLNDGNSRLRTTSCSEEPEAQSFQIYAALRTPAPLTDDHLASLNRSLRPADESLCLWRDEKNESVLRLSVDLESHDYQEALREGLVIAQEAVQLVGPGSTVLELVAVTEEGQSRYTAQPGQRG